MKLIMTLLSDALPGSGEGLSGIIDDDVNYDKYGLPYIPAKRLKGVLREAALDLCDVDKLTKEQVETLFGKRGKKRGAALRISDGYLPSYPRLRAFLDECSKKKKKYGASFHRQGVLDFYAYTRAQTAIQDDVAKEHSLRTFRVLKKGLIFEFECEDLPDELSKLLESICKVTRRFGSSRTRGLGEISLRCDNSSAQSDTSAQGDDNEELLEFQADEICRYRLDIQTHGQILVTNEVGSEQVSEAYLPGSFLLGALADAYIQRNHLKNAHEDSVFREVFLHGSVQFGNAYPVKDDKVYFPSPVSIAKEKDVNHYFDLAHSELDDDIQTKGGIGEFVIFEGNEAQTYSPEKEIEYHHARPEDKRWLGHAKEDDGQFFQFEVLAPHQQFRADVIGKYAHLSLIQSLIANMPTVFLGKSKTAQYGKCSLVGTLEKVDVFDNPITWPNDEKLVVTLASDMLLCNENGLIRPDPAYFKTEFVKYLKPIVDEKMIKIENTFLKTKRIGGFVGVWNMPKIQATALTAGSVILLRNMSGQDIDVTALQMAAFGLRTEEGFGRITLNWHGEYHEIKHIKPKEDSMPNFESDLTPAAVLIEHIIMQHIQSALKAKARSSITQNHEKIKNAFLGRLRLFLESSNTFEAFQERCSAMKSRGRDSLMKLDDVLFLDEQKTPEQDDGQNSKNVIVDVKKFNGFVNGLSQVIAIRDWQYPVLQSANIQLDDILQTHLFEWYKLYALHFITLLKFYKRNQGGNNREK